MVSSNLNKDHAHLMYLTFYNVISVYFSQLLLLEEKSDITCTDEPKNKNVCLE